MQALQGRADGEKMKAAAKKALPKEEVEFFYAVEQGSPEWRSLHINVPSASKFATIMASGKDGGESLGRRKLLYQMAGEVLTGEPAENFQNGAMLRGNEMETEACDYYGRTRFLDLAQVGFVKRTIPNPLGSALVIGCSPDRLIGDDGALEVKTMRPDLLIECALKGAAGFPSEHRHQCQGTLLVTGRAWVDLLIFYRGMPVAPVFRVERDEAFIGLIRNALEIFAYDLRMLVTKVRSLGGD